MPSHNQKSKGSAARKGQQKGHQQGHQQGHQDRYYYPQQAHQGHQANYDGYYDYEEQRAQQAQQYYQQQYMEEIRQQQHDNQRQQQQSRPQGRLVTIMTWTCSKCGTAGNSIDSSHCVYDCDHRRCSECTLERSTAYVN